MEHFPHPQEIPSDLSPVNSSHTQTLIQLFFPDSFPFSGMSQK